MSDASSSEVEKEVLSRDKAASLAMLRKTEPIPKHISDIAPSLLSAEDIKSVVLATGLIAPFHLGGKKQRLKKASYEGRIGQNAYIYKDHQITPATFTDNKLLIPANSIVFVESDLDFNLPDYIALRFNLHISHVHRGLLLGTGPLIDPGFVGKLCIPLHNLTSEDYEISRDEGLIWLEFTKTTLRTGTSSGMSPSTSGYKDIRDFIRKAANGVNGNSAVTIQSSIGDALTKSKEAAEASAKEAKDSKYLVTAGVISAIIAGIALTTNMVNAINAQTNLSKQYIDGATSRLSENSKSLERHDGRLDALESDQNSIVRRLETAEVSQRRIEALERTVKDLERALSPRDTPPTSKSRSSPQMR